VRRYKGGKGEVGVRKKKRTKNTIRSESLGGFKKDDDLHDVQTERKKGRFETRGKEGRREDSIYSKWGRGAVT